MPSFDIVSEVNNQEVTNAVDQSNREVGTRFDFKGSNAKFELEDNKVTMRAPNDFQLKQMLDILRERLARRNVDVRCLQVDSPQVNVSEAWQIVTIRQGIEAELARVQQAEGPDNRHPRVHSMRFRITLSELSAS